MAAGKSSTRPLSGRAIWTRCARSSIVASRPLSPGPRGVTRTGLRPRQAASSRAANSFLPSARLRFCAARTIRSRPAGEERVDVALPVGHHGQPGRTRQGLGRTAATRQPARRFLLLGGPTALISRRLLVPRPDRRIDQADHRLAFNLHGNHRVDEEARRRPVRRRAEPAPLPVPIGEGHLRRVLHQQDRPAHAGCCRSSRQCLHDPLDRHIGRGQKAMHRYLAGPRLSQLAHHQ
jgi:hypothetical protein